ncbi:MAG: peptidylprolyl isomerase [Cryomorphaceae bacterium]
MNILRTFKPTNVIFSIFFALLCSACQGPANSERAASAPPQKSSIQKDTFEQTQPPKKARPQAGHIKQFFLEYGDAHPETLVRLSTRLGEIDIRLYEETPVHRSNFLYNVNEELYHHTIFYRVVPGFMIQGGNSDHDQTIEKRKEAGAYYITNEVRPDLIHKRGAVAMAMSYDDNPDHKSAQYSFYIVIGKRLNDAGLDAVEEEYQISIPPRAREVYKEIGGSPHLDGVHTVFGEVVEGMDVVEAIAAEKRDSGNWPINDVVIEYSVLE